MSNKPEEPIYEGYREWRTKSPSQLNFQSGIRQGVQMQREIVLGYRRAALRNKVEGYFQPLKREILLGELRACYQGLANAASSLVAVAGVAAVFWMGL